MKRTTLGITGIEVSELCYGTLTLGPLQAQIPAEDGADAIRYALDRGVNFIDTAHSYQTYDHVRPALKGVSDVVLASKSTAATAREMREAVLFCLEKTGRETIDIFLLHYVNSERELHSREGALEELVRCREEGLIREAGLSSHSPAGIEAALKYPDLRVVLPILNRNGLGIVRGSREDMITAIQHARESGRGVYDMKPLGGGHLIGDIPAAIDYLRDSALFHSIAVGMKNRAEVTVMADLFEDVPGARERALEDGRTRGDKKRLIVQDFCAKCGACTRTCAQGAITLGRNKAEVNHEACILCGYCAAACPAFALRVV